MKNALRKRLLIAASTALAIAASGYLLHALTQVPATQVQTDPGPAAGDLLSTQFQQGVEMLNAGQYEQAVSAFHGVLRLAPTLPEAHVNMGFALLGTGDADAALDFFGSAIDLRPAQANAYFGLAEALEARGDLETAMGAMRSFIHLSEPGDPYLDKARAALWEWEAELARRGSIRGGSVATPAVAD